MPLAQAIATCRVQLATRVAENMLLPPTGPASSSRTVANGRPTHGRQRPTRSAAAQNTSLLSSLCKAEKHLHADPKPVQIKEESQLCPIAGEGGRDTKSLNRFQLKKCALNPLRMSCCQNES